jgi:hypothetical protein
MKTIQEQREERRQAKLKHMQRQINAGRLVVRHMTAEERDSDVVFPRKPESPGSPEPR